MILVNNHMDLLYVSTKLILIMLDFSEESSSKQPNIFFVKRKLEDLVIKLIILSLNLHLKIFNQS